MLLTDGEWTGMDGTLPLGPANQNPAITAADLFDNQGIKTYVVVIGGDPNAEVAADETAAAGGTLEAFDGDTPELLTAALDSVVQDIVGSVVTPKCGVTLPRVMVLLDASSSMLNTNGGTLAGTEGETGWDHARDALAGDQSLFDIDVGVSGLGDVGHIGLAVFGHNQPGPGEQKLLVDYGPCTKDKFVWALDPNTACEMPGCDDPWSGPPITWTFKDGQVDANFDEPTYNHMPQCGGNADFCSGSGTYTHLGLQLIKDNQVAYHAAAQTPQAAYPADVDTTYLNILITDGQYTLYSTDAQVSAELTQMYADGITTFVIGFGDGVDAPQAIAQLSDMANWGSGGQENYFDANNQAELEMALGVIFGQVQFDPCCVLQDCAACG